MKRLVSLVLFVILCSSCFTEQDGCERIISIDIDSCLTTGGVSIYDIFTKVELIQLDDSIPISNTVHTGMTNITTDGHNFYLLDSKNLSIHVYASDGKLLNHADNVGRGPGEYTMACQINYNPSLNLIEILNPIGKILRYSCDSLKFVSELNFTGGPSATHYVSQVGENYYLYSHTDEDQLHMLSEDSDKSIPLGFDSPEYLRKYMSSSSGIFMISGRPCVFRPYDGQIFHIDAKHESLIPLIGWNMGKYTCRLGDIPIYDDARKYEDFIINYSQNHIAAFCSICGMKEHIFAAMVLKGEIYILCYNLVDNQYHVFNKTKEGMSFLPELFHGKSMFKYVEYMTLPSYVNKAILDDKSKEIYDLIIREEGSAIIKYTL